MIMVMSSHFVKGPNWEFYFFLQLSSQGQEKAGFTAVIDWRAFLVSLADAHFDYCISASTLDDIVLARTGNDSLDIIHIVCMCVWWIQWFLFKASPWTPSFGHDLLFPLYIRTRDLVLDVFCRFFPCGGDQKDRSSDRRLDDFGRLSQDKSVV